MTHAPDLTAIHAVYNDPQIEGMEALYAAIAEQLNSGADFEQAYATVVASGGPIAATWIRFCVQCTTRFSTPPIEADFLAVLEQVSRQHLERTN